MGYFDDDDNKSIKSVRWVIKFMTNIKASIPRDQKSKQNVQNCLKGL